VNLNNTSWDKYSVVFASEQSYYELSKQQALLEEDYRNITRQVSELVEKKKTRDYKLAGDT